MSTSVSLTVQPGDLIPLSSDGADKSISDRRPFFTGDSSAATRVFSAYQSTIKMAMGRQG